MMEAVIISETSANSEETTRFKTQADSHLSVKMEYFQNRKDW
jgi:hypothetical protein